MGGLMNVECRVGYIYAYRPDSGDLLLVISQDEFRCEILTMQTGFTKWRSVAWLDVECTRLA